MLEVALTVLKMLRAHMEIEAVKFETGHHCRGNSFSKQLLSRLAPPHASIVWLHGVAAWLYGMPFMTWLKEIPFMLVQGRQSMQPYQNGAAVVTEMSAD